MTTSSPPLDRVAALDLTKGSLVVCMVIYHSLNYTTEFYQAFRYFAFLPPSFIVITGFLISRVYRSKYSVNDFALVYRLVLRGTKLFLLFTGLNVLIQATVPRNVFGAPTGLAAWWDYWFETFVTGEGRTASFEVLLPIAYLLLLAPVVLFLDRLHWLVLPVGTLALVATNAWMAKHGEEWFNAQLMSAGLIGVLLGRVSFAQLGRLSDRWIPLILSYAGYFVASRLIGQSYLLQLLGAVVALAVIYSICVRVKTNARLAVSVALLGRYSLIAYIGQIAILQVISRVMPRPEPWSIGFLILFLCTLALTVLGVLITDAGRRASSTLGGAYQTIFA